MNTSSTNKYQICFGGRHHNPISFATQDALVAWIYDQMCEQTPDKIRPLNRIESIKLNGRTVSGQTMLAIWRAVEQRRDREKDKQAPTSC
jgi:hypothetical protein